MRRLAAVSLLWALGACATAGAGSFAITGEKVMDECPQAAIYLAAKHVFVDPAGGTLYADVVNRTYALRVHGDELVASGRFPTPYCAPARLDERWRLRGANDLEGTLESTWPRPGDCSTTCTVRFDIHASRLRPGPPGDAFAAAARAGGEQGRSSGLVEAPPDRALAQTPVAHRAVPAAERDVPLDREHLRMAFGAPYCAVSHSGTLAYCASASLEECQRRLDASPAGAFRSHHACAARPPRVSCFAYEMEGRPAPGWHCTTAPAACEQHRASFRDIPGVAAVSPCSEVALP